MLPPRPPGSTEMTASRVPCCFTSLKFFTGYLIERSLSIDNIFVFLLVFNFFKVPEDYQYKVLFWGIIGALVFRGLFIGIGALCVLPLAIDGFTQLLTDRESTAFLRLTTGIPFGFVLGLFFAAAYGARPNRFDRAGDVRLPGNVRFQRTQEVEEE